MIPILENPPKQDPATPISINSLHDNSYECSIWGKTEIDWTKALFELKKAERVQFDEKIIHINKMQSKWEYLTCCANFTASGGEFRMNILKADFLGRSDDSSY
jgi:hypothetical protein